MYYITVDYERQREDLSDFINEACAAGHTARLSLDGDRCTLVLSSSNDATMAKLKFY